MEQLRPIVRTPEEIAERLRQLKLLEKGHDVRIHNGYGSSPNPETEPIRRVLAAKIQVLKWLTGEEVDILEGF